jgi:protein-tyrosine phosphatase
MELFQIDDGGQLFISPAIDCWDDLAAAGIDVVIDLEGGLDECIPTDLNHCLYVYFPIADDNEELPPLTKLRAVARLGAELIAEGHRVLSHCGMGFNRSALVAGMILVEMGLPGATVVDRLQARRPGALFNDRFAEFLRGEPARTALRT